MVAIGAERNVEVALELVDGSREDAFGVVIFVVDNCCSHSVRAKVGFSSHLDQLFVPLIRSPKSSL